MTPLPDAGGLPAIRVAAVADVHAGIDSTGAIRPGLARVADEADVLLIAGDLTRYGRREEAEVLARELDGLDLPIVAVLGNHDHESDDAAGVVEAVQAAGVRVLEGTCTRLEIAGTTLGVAGVKGFGGGFTGASGSDFGEPEMKAFMRHSRDAAARLEAALDRVDARFRVALTHYSPVPDTLEGERLEIYPFLGSSHLAVAADRAGCALILHGHAHGGRERGRTPGGIPVRNVALPVIGGPYRVYVLRAGTPEIDDAAPAAWECLL